MHLYNNGNQLIYSTQDGLLSVLHIEYLIILSSSLSSRTRQDDSFSQSLEFAKAVPSVVFSYLFSYSFTRFLMLVVLLHHFIHASSILL